MFRADAVDHQLVEDCLCLYPVLQRHLVDFTYSCAQLRATILPHDIDYSTIKVGYYTASQLVVVASQMSYVLGGCAFFDASFPVLGEYFYPTYLELLRAGQLYYTQLGLRLRRKTSNSVPHGISMKISSLVGRNGLYLMASRLLLPQGNGSVDVTTAMSTRRRVL